MQIASQPTAFLLAGGHQVCAGTLELAGQLLQIRGQTYCIDGNARLPSQVLEEASIGRRKSFARGARSQKKLPDMLSLIGKRNRHSFILRFSIRGDDGKVFSVL